MSLTSQVSALATQLGTDVKALIKSLGNLADLTTDAKDDLVVALNELKTGLTANETAIAALIDDGTTGADSTWSSTKIAEAIQTAIDEVVDGAPTALDTLKELADAFENNSDAIAALETIAAGHVKFDESQSLTDEQKQTARTNIDAASTSDITGLSTQIVEIAGQASEAVSTATAALSTANEAMENAIAARSQMDSVAGQLTDAVTTASEAKTAAEAAQTAAETAQAAAETAASDAAAIASTAEEAKTLAEQAATDAASARTTAEGIASTAEDAKTTAEAAAADATSARTTAEGIASTAAQAATDAADAKTAAEEAKTLAEEAKSTAESAVTDAADAKSTAETAASDAASAKTAAEQAATDAADAKTTAESISATAEEAKTTAENAMAAVDAAVSGKSDIGHSHVIADVTSLQDELDNRTVRAITSDTGTAYVWNETSGGGARYDHTDGSRSFVGVNYGGADDIAAQIYAKNNTTNVGTRVNVYNKGVYYIPNKSNTDADYVADDPDCELAVKGDLTLNPDPLETYLAALEA